MAKRKKSTFKLPKKIAGVQIPEALRTPGTSLKDFLETPTGREVLAGVLVAVAGALAGSEKVRTMLAGGSEALAHAAQDGGRTATDAITSKGPGATDAITGAAAGAAGHGLLSPAKEDEGDNRQAPGAAGVEREQERESDRPSSGADGGTEPVRPPVTSNDDSRTEGSSRARARKT